MKNNKFKKALVIILKIAAIFFIGAIAAVITEHYIFPQLSASQSLSKYKLFKKASENVTIINKTEQVTVREDDSVISVASQAIPTIANIVSFDSQGNVKKGTGVFATSDGLIVTYRTAIIETGSDYLVLIFDGTQHNAQLAGIDEFTNLAFLKIDSSNLPAISFANSPDYNAGKKLIAIGNSSGEYQNRFTAGLLSNINKTFNIAGKTISSTESLEGVFETDFDNQKEYLGGPVVDYNGQLGGIIGSAAIDNKDHFFQIPSSAVKESADRAINNELEIRPVLGLYYMPITKSYSVVNDIKRDRGALIYSSSGRQNLAIISGSIAEKSGLKINDIIIAVNGVEVNLDNPLSNLVNKYSKGDTIEFLILRDGEEIKKEIKL